MLLKGGARCLGYKRNGVYSCMCVRVRGRGRGRGGGSRREGAKKPRLQEQNNCVFYRFSWCMSVLVYTSHLFTITREVQGVPMVHPA